MTNNNRIMTGTLFATPEGHKTAYFICLRKGKAHIWGMMRESKVTMKGPLIIY